MSGGGTYPEFIDTTGLTSWRPEKAQVVIDIIKKCALTGYNYNKFTKVARSPQTNATVPTNNSMSSP